MGGDEDHPQADLNPSQTGIEIYDVFVVGLVQLLYQRRGWS
jgi:hypothetical protein